jgi:2Fe-2S ferredoxin
MPRVLFFGSDGERNELEVPVGHSLMEAALDNSVAGIVAECSGACACATCHAYVADVWTDKLPAISEMEDSMLDAVTDRRTNSRLTCQIEMTEALDGIEIHAADNEN